MLLELLIYLIIHQEHDIPDDRGLLVPRLHNRVMSELLTVAWVVSPLQAVSRVLFRKKNKHSISWGFSTGIRQNIPWWLGTPCATIAQSSHVGPFHRSLGRLAASGRISCSGSRTRRGRIRAPRDRSWRSMRCYSNTKANKKRQQLNKKNLACFRLHGREYSTADERLTVASLLQTVSRVADQKQGEEKSENGEAEAEEVSVATQTKKLKTNKRRGLNKSCPIT